MRKNNYDTLKGILIFLTVFAHFLITYDYLPISKYNIIINSIYFFHMPLFFIISGHFSNNKSKSNIIKLLLIFLFMNTTFFLYDYIHFGRIDIFKVYYSSWYILLLTIYRLIVTNKKISNILNNLKNKNYLLIVLFLISTISGFCFEVPTIARFFSCSFYFFFGYLTNYKTKKKESLLLILISILLMAIVLKSNISLDFLMNSNYKNTSEIILKMVTIVANSLLYIGIINLINNKKIPIFTNIGRNSLYIYIFHRIPVLILGYIIYPQQCLIIKSLIISLILCLIITSLSKKIQYLLNSKFLIITSIICFIIPIISLTKSHELTINEQINLDDSITLGFVGDLILLEDQLKLSNNNFDYMFDNMKSYFENTDYVFGVLEGPVDDDNNYSFGNFDDGKKLRLNYPTSFLKSIEKSGIDFVTISNNHLLDSGVNSYKNTINNLNNSKIDYTGTKNNHKIIEIQGIKIGVLSYTYGLNYLNKNDYKEYTNFLVDPQSNEFKEKKKEIKQDFKKLKDSNVDMIIVFPHYGTQFNYKIDTYQETYNRLFISEGANIIFGDHPHVIEPIQYKNNSIIINSPGNYINSWIGYDSDISMYVKVYIDKKNLNIKASSITPIIATKDDEGKYYPELLENTSDINKKRELNILSNTIFNKDIKDINNTYYYLSNKEYKIPNEYKLEINNDDKNSLMYKKISEHNKICFIGDSITKGSKNNNYPWYIPLMNNFDKEVVNISQDSYTSQSILDNFSDTIKESNCDLNIINIGTNDIRYNKTNVNTYISNIIKIISLTKGETIILAPWQTTKKDYNIAKNDTEKRELYSTYNNQLAQLKNVYYIDPNIYIKKVLEYNGEDNYLIDGIHPNEKEGIKLYSFATLRQ